MLNKGRNPLDIPEKNHASARGYGKPPPFAIPRWLKVIQPCHFDYHCLLASRGSLGIIEISHLKTNKNNPTRCFAPLAFACPAAQGHVQGHAVNLLLNARADSVHRENQIPSRRTAVDSRCVFQKRLPYCIFFLHTGSRFFAHYECFCGSLRTSGPS